MPRALGNVHQRSRTPHLAAIMLMSLLLPLGMFGSIANLASASVLLLLAVFAVLAVVNGALFILNGRRSEPVGRFEIPRWVPAAGTVICLLLVGSGFPAVTGTPLLWLGAPGGNPGLVCTAAFEVGLDCSLVAVL